MTSRVGRSPIELPSGVEFKVDGCQVEIKGSKGVLGFALPKGITVAQEGKTLMIKAEAETVNGEALAGTTRAILNNHVTGVREGFTRKLLLVGVGYRAAATKVGNRAKLDLTLGVSHPVSFLAPVGIEIATPVVTEILISGIDKQLVGQVAANIRGICGGIRKPEPYKGKGIRYSDERIILKETKKK